MSNKRVNILIMAIVLSVSLVAASCAKKPSDLESFIQTNDEVNEEIQKTADNVGLSVEIKGNDVIYSYDISTISGMDKETLKDPVMVENLQGALDSQKSTFVNLCKQLEDQTGFTGIKLIVNYNFGDEILVSHTFTSTD